MSVCLLLTLRDAATLCPNVLTRKMLRDSADEIATLVYQTYNLTSLNKIEELNGAVAKAMRTLALADQEGGGGKNHGPFPREKNAD